MLLHRYLVYRLPAEAASSHCEALPAGSCEPASVETVCQLFCDDAPRRAAFLSFLHQGMRGIFLFEGRAWWSYAWMTRPGSAGPAHLPSWAEREGVHWIFFCRTRERSRGQGLYGVAMSRLTASARREDPRAKIYIDTTAGNTPSRRAIIKAGFEPCGVALVLDVPGLRPRGVWLSSRAHPR